MPQTIGIVCNLYNEANALPGWLEMATSFADDVQVYHSGPGGAMSNDGTIEILEKWKIPIHRGTIDDGFGIARNAAIQATRCDWAMLLDADERFYQFAPVLTCSGPSTPPDMVNQVLQAYDNREQKAVPSNYENLYKLGMNLSVVVGEIYNQGAWLRSIIQDPAIDGVATIRRHWHDFTWKRPTQNWQEIPDYQLRIVRKHPRIHFNANVRMHEQMMGVMNPYRPNMQHGPYYDHHHLFWKEKAQADRRFKLRVYDALHSGQEMPKP